MIGPSPPTRIQRTTQNPGNTTEPSTQLSAGHIAGIAAGGGGAVILIILAIAIPTAIRCRKSKKSLQITSKTLSKHHSGVSGIPSTSHLYKSINVPKETFDLSLSLNTAYNDPKVYLAKGVERQTKCEENGSTPTTINQVTTPEGLPAPAIRANEREVKNLLCGSNLTRGIECHSSAECIRTANPETSHHYMQISRSRSVPLGLVNLTQESEFTSAEKEEENDYEFMGHNTNISAILATSAKQREENEYEYQEIAMELSCTPNEAYGVLADHVPPSPNQDHGVTSIEEDVDHRKSAPSKGDNFIDDSKPFYANFTSIEMKSAPPFEDANLVEEPEQLYANIDATPTSPNSVYRVVGGSTHPTDIDTPLQDTPLSPIPGSPHIRSSPLPDLPLVRGSPIPGSLHIRSSPLPDIPLIRGSSIPGSPHIRSSPLPDIPLVWGSPIPDIPLVRGSPIPGSPLFRGSPIPGSPLNRSSPLQDMPLIRGSPIPGTSLVRGSSLPGTPLPGTPLLGSPLVRGSPLQDPPLVRGSPLPDTPLEVTTELYTNKAYGVHTEKPTTPHNHAHGDEEELYCNAAYGGIDLSNYTNGDEDLYDYIAIN